MNGMEMMLKSFGIDIEAIKAEMNGTIENIIGGIKLLANRQEDTRIRVIRMEAKLDLLMKELRVQAPIELVIEHSSTNGAGATPHD